MSETPEAILKDFHASGWNGNPFIRTITLVQHDPYAATLLIRLAMQAYTESSTFLDAAMSFMPLEAMSELAHEALSHFKSNPKHELAESVLAYISLMQPSALHPLLDEILALQPNRSTYCEPYPWRESGGQHIEVLRQAIALAEANFLEVSAIQSRLLEIRTPEALRLAVDHGSNNSSGADYRLQQVGFMQEGEDFRQLYPDATWHIRFQDAQLPKLPSHLGTTYHPTWQLPAEDTEYSFGGSLEGCTCGLCGGTLHQLIDLNPLPDGLGVSLKRLKLGTCLSCLGWTWAGAFLYFQHDAHGKPTALDSLDPFEEPQFPSGPLLPQTVTLAHTPDRWKWQDWGLSNSRENLHRIGGYPTWIQSAEYPECPHCQQPMSFLMQLDSYLPTADGGEWLWGSGGIVYVHWCDGCRVSAMLWQCT